MAGKQPITKKETSATTRNVVTIILLLLTFIVPLIGVIGIFVMWFWTTWKKWVKILITTLFVLPVILISLFLIIYIFIARPFQIAGEAMSPTYHDGAYVVTSIYNPYLKSIDRGDIIVFRAPPDQEKDFIKRVIALPGDTIELNNGSVYLNSKKLDESAYLKNDIGTYGGAFLPEEQPFTVPESNYFVIGDNRPFSSDSREWGLVPQNYIISKVDFCYWNCK